jgi:hypothetical protein
MILNSDVNVIHPRGSAVGTVTNHSLLHMIKANSSRLNSVHSQLLSRPDVDILVLPVAATGNRKWLRNLRE